ARGSAGSLKWTVTRSGWQLLNHHPKRDGLMFARAIRVLRGSPGSHRRLIVAGATLLAVASIGEIGVASGAANLLPNGTFEGSGSGSLSGWSGMNASLALAADGVGGGHAAKVTFTTGTGTYSINASPKPVGSTTAGTKYVADGMFRSATPGQTICFRLKEANSSNIGKGQGQQCAIATTTWQAFPEIDYTSVNTGDSIAVRIYQ